MQILYEGLKALILNQEKDDDEDEWENRRFSMFNHKIYIIRSEQKKIFIYI